ncbi:MAG TPA: CDP-glucose 4,6-dehydratase [Terracidiphilus sp.]|jgi:CDP-glucose 4,6-dehydratase|nr:CDP-glucose 4,6-dehydratase [Terracidiphilus sp.]
MEVVVTSWKGRRVFLTGHTGFKGSWLSLWLASRGAVIRGYALDPEPGRSMFAAASIGEVLEDVRGDIRDLATLQKAISEFHPEVVFHLAAQPLVRRSYADPVGTFATNVMGTAHLLEAVRQTPSVRAVVCVTTDKVYQNGERERPYTESDRLGGSDPYSSSKACSELVVAAYRSSYFPVDELRDQKVSVATVRAGNVIGGGDWAQDRLIPDLVRGFEMKRPVLIRRPNAIRPWQHVLDPLGGYIQLAERMLAQPEGVPESLNFGPRDEDAWPVGAIASKVAGLWGEDASWVRDESEHVREHHTLRLDASRARSVLGWYPRLGIETALEWTVDWYRSWLEGRDMRDETKAQIDRFAGLS